MKAFKNVKSILSVFLILVMVTALFTACSYNFRDNNSDENQIRHAKDLKSYGITEPYVNPKVKFSNLTSKEEQAELSKDLEKLGIKESYMTDENLKAFENFYAPIPASTSLDKEVQKKVLERAIKERGIQFKHSKLKFIGLLVHDTADESKPFLFLDHAGVISEKNGSVYLLEKLAFQKPYQWIKFPAEEEIIKYFESKYDLDTTGRMAKPIYMINDTLF